MKNKTLKKMLPIITLVFYLVMILVNALANILPINNLTTGEVSDAYGNLFAPAAVTFSIWILIYLLLLMYTVYQLIYYRNKSDEQRAVLETVSTYFALSSVFNTLWILAWHYEVIWLSVLLMLGILFCLIKINLFLSDKDLTTEENRYMKLPFSVYFGWITVATIANITVFLVSLNWNGFGLPATFWTVLVIIVGAIIGYLGMEKYHTKAYGLVIIWAYVGIIIKHVSNSGFAMQYPIIIGAAVISIILLVFKVSKMLAKKK